MPSPINYQIRPSKHVERKIFVETLQNLRSIGYNIPDYHYVGFGSIYFIDFILFHRLLAIKKMTSLEKKRSLTKRVEFNKPYKFINVKITDFASYVTQIKNNIPYLVWLDYENALDEDILTSIGSLAHTLMNGSILIVTVNCKLRLASDTSLAGEDAGSELRSAQIEELKSQYQDKLGPFCGEVKKRDISKGGFPKLFSRTLSRKIQESIKSGRPDDEFIQLFNYVYQDGTQMLTFGGMIEHAAKRGTVEDAVRNLDYINPDSEPTSIAIPALTVTEKLHLDKKLEVNGTIQGDTGLDLDTEEIENYTKFAKHYPSFHEVFMG